MIRITYDPYKGMTMPEGLVRAYVESYLTGTNNVEDSKLSVGMEYLIHEFRLSVLNNKLSHTHLIFIFNDEEIQVTKYGRLHSWPNGFCDRIEKQLGELIGWNNEKQINTETP
jgi:hypothetical protein